MKQITVNLENSVGRLSEIAGILGKAGINILAEQTMSISGSIGIFSFIPEDIKAARHCLMANSIQATVETVIGVVVEDKPNSLHRLTKILAEAGINIKRSYSVVAGGMDGKARLVFGFEKDDLEKAENLLTKNGYVLTDLCQRGNNGELVILKHCPFSRCGATIS